MQARVPGAASDPTYLMAPVEVVATYKLAGIDRHRLGAIFHRVFAAARLDLAIPGRCGGSARAREWFLAPFLPSMRRWNKSGTARSLRVYDRHAAALVPGWLAPRADAGFPLGTGRECGDRCGRIHSLRLAHLRLEHSSLRRADIGRAKAVAAPECATEMRCIDEP